MYACEQCVSTDGDGLQTDRAQCNARKPDIAANSAVEFDQVWTLVIRAVDHAHDRGAIMAINSHSGSFAQHSSFLQRRHISAHIHFRRTVTILLRLGMLMCELEFDHVCNARMIMRDACMHATWRVVWKLISTRVLRTDRSLGLRPTRYTHVPVTRATAMRKFLFIHTRVAYITYSSVGTRLFVYFQAMTARTILRPFSPHTC